MLNGQWPAQVRRAGTTLRGDEPGGHQCGALRPMPVTIDANY
jgi:hypothetical protein